MPYASKPKFAKRKSAPRRARRAVKSVPKMSAALKSLVKSAVARQAETKFATPLTANNVAILPYDATSQLLTTINLTTALNIAQGTGQGDRIGDEITVHNMTFKGFMTVSPSLISADTSPCYVKMVIGRQKVSLIQPTSYANLYQAGNGVAAPSNLPTDIIRSFNRDAWVILQSKVFKLGFANVPNSTGGSSQANNDFALCRLFSLNLNKHIHKVKYSDGGAQPQNVGLFVWFLLCNANGSTITATANIPAPEIHYTVDVAYKDA